MVFDSDLGALGESPMEQPVSSPYPAFRVPRLAGGNSRARATGMAAEAGATGPAKTVVVALDNNQFSMTVDPELLSESTLLRAMLPENRECPIRTLTAAWS